MRRCNSSVRISAFLSVDDGIFSASGGVER